MPELLKDRFFTKTFIEELAEVTHKNYSDFDKSKFKSLVFSSDWNAKELKEKMRHITLCLGETLPQNYESALEILQKIAPEFSGFDGMVFPDFVEVYGLNNFYESLKALEHLTKFSSSEFAIRHFLLKDQNKVIDLMLKWSKSENFHVRRLASEGCRPRLPWAIGVPNLKKNPKPILPILENLKADETDYVRRSVANNLNDISKDFPDLVLEICEGWYGKHKNTNWIVKHALRGLLKKGNPRALILFGFGKPENVEVSNLVLDKNYLRIGEEFNFSFEIQIPKDSSLKLRIEYAIHFCKANGSLSKKVFSISENTFSKPQTDFSKKHSFKDLTTRKHYSGEHFLEIIVNGVTKQKFTFLLEA
ncbi:MAG: DNA alkylation repair protein [Calditrichaeota bacterium]|nr:MAG: DNA alkylation repair protein [Calditrichota bacterium]